MKIKFASLFVFLLFTAPLATNVSALTADEINPIISAFRKYKDVGDTNLLVPKVLQVPMENIFLERNTFGVLNRTENKFESYLYQTSISAVPTPVSVSTSPPVGNPERMTDADYRTFSEFTLPEGGNGFTNLTVSSTSPITSSRIRILLDNNVALPNSVEIKANTSEGMKTIVARKPLTGQSISFPRTTADQWFINLEYSQLLRITEISFDEENPDISNSAWLRFLAKPGNDYRIYFDADRWVSIPLSESPNLYDSKDVVRIAALETKDNPSYVAADVDADGIPDTRDNCVSVSNSDQKDLDINGRGDACDDFDKDGVINSQDNCRDLPNRYQEDTDADLIGNACDDKDNRVTENHPWLPWAGMGLAAAVLISLFAITARSVIRKR